MEKIAFILLITLIGFLTGCRDKSLTEKEKNQLSRKSRVETIVVKMDLFESDLNYSGIIVPHVSTSLSFQLPGQVKKIYADQGDRVKEGQLLAELDKTSAESSYKIALAMQKQAQDAYDRLKTVYTKGSLPEIQWEEMKSKLQQANSSLMIAEQNLKHTNIICPKNGIIGSRNIEVGSTATPGITAFDLLNIEKVYVRISVPENEIMKIFINQTATVSIPAIGTKLYEARVEKIGVEANLISKTYEVKLLLENPGFIIKPGMACDINLRAKNVGQAISLPYKAINQDANNQTFVYKIELGSKKAIRQPVIVSAFLNNEVTISSGVQTGDIIVVNGQHKLYDNADVILSN